MEKILKFENVSKSFFTEKGETRVLENISFELFKGKTLAIVGPSGCGKSTILNLISGLEKTTSGQVKCLGTMGYMFQKDNLLNWRTVYKNITLGLEVQKKLDDKTKEYIEYLLKEYGLSEFRNFFPKELSGGMRQRVALIRTLALNPDILLLDEPFSALDYQTKLIVQNDVFNIINRENKTTVLVTHDISEAIAMADYVLVLSKRPAKAKSTHKIVLSFNGEKSPLNARSAPEFQNYFDLIWKELNNHE